ncbi:MAG: DNA-methyltransferase [Sedimentisphaeraceae bacterium JB056]
MAELNEKSVQLIVTSPPYWQLKDYGNTKQIGFDDSYEDYVNNLNIVWNECYRVLENGCRLCINIGDQFARSVYYGRYKIIPIRTEIIRFCETIGFDYMGAVIWQKVTTCNTTGGGAVMGSFPNPRNGILKLDYEFILLFKKGGKPRVIPKEIKQKSSMTKEEWNEYFTGHWNFSGERQNGHLAMFPEELPKRLIKMFSFVGETVLDPFMGSGTTALAARNQGRNSVGYEINEEFIPLIEKRSGFCEQGLFREDSIEFTKQKSEIDISNSLSFLPYLFEDKVKFDKKIDPRKMDYGSKVSKKSTGKRNDLKRVTEIISPNKLMLDDGVKVKLIGVAPIAEKEYEAISYLKDKIGRQRVFLKFDNQKYDAEGNLLCYLYLQNKTFVNAHLIKDKMAAPVTNQEYSCKRRFEKYMEMANA